jgi:hypothetical protein
MIIERLFGPALLIFFLAGCAGLDTREPNRGFQRFPQNRRLPYPAPKPRRKQFPCRRNTPLRRAWNSCRAPSPCLRPGRAPSPAIRGTDPLARNWRSREAAPTSWSMPSLVLAIRGRESGDASLPGRGRRGAALCPGDHGSKTNKLIEQVR